MKVQFFRFTTLVLITSVILAGGLTHATPKLHAASWADQVSPIRSMSLQSEPTLTFAQAQKQLDTLFKQVTALRKLIDRTQFDLDALGFELDGDPAKIIKFVTNQIAFEQYPGLLRGAQGTLMSRAGNALDQAILLHRLLVDAGYEAKILHGTLDEASGRTLLMQMFEQRSQPLPISQNMDKVRKLFADMADKIGMSETDSTPMFDAAFQPQAITTTNYFTYTESDSDLLKSLLEKAGVKLGDPDTESRLIAEVQDYFWVEYRLGPIQRWQPVHPAFGKAALPAKLKVNETFAEERAIPDTLRHLFRVEVSIERKVGDILESQIIVPAQEAAVADLIGKPYTFAITPDGIASADTITDPLEILAASNFFFPTLNGTLMKDAQAFDRFGNIAPPDVASSPFAGLFSGTSGKLSGAVDALSGLDSGEGTDGQQQFLLTAAYIDFMISMPGQTPKTIRRTLVDRIGAKNRAADKMALADRSNELTDLVQLTAKSTFMLAAGRYPDAHTFDRQLEYYQSLRPLFDLVLKSDYQSITQNDISKAKLDRLKAYWPGHFNLYPIFDQGAAIIGALNYRSEASLVIHRQEQQTTSTRVWIDIANNARRAYTLVDDRIQPATATLLKTGVWETMTEGAVLTTDLADPLSTMAVFDEATRQKIDLRVLTPDDRADIDTLDLSEQARTNLRADLDAGNVVILPAKQPKNIDLTGWWRIDPRTGQTLGLLENGMGTATVEYALTLVLFGTCIGVASADTNGVSIQDLVVCGTLAIGGFAAMPAKITARIIMGMIAGAAGTGFWLNNSPGLQRPILRR